MVSFQGSGTKEKGYITDVDKSVFSSQVGSQYLEQIRKRIFESGNLNPIVIVDPKYFRPTEVELLIGDSSKAREKLGWLPKYDLKGLVADMIQSDVKLMKKDAYLSEGGYRTLNYFE